MSALSMMEERLPPGFRFHPRDDELVCDYLENKISGTDNGSYHCCLMLVEVDLNKCEPWELPEIARVGGKEWYFFSLRDRKYATGQRTNRATESGYWKATGKDRPVMKKGVLVGMRKTLVFYQGRAPKGKKTDWVMHEFRIETNSKNSTNISTKDWGLFRVFFKSRSTAPNLAETAVHRYDHNASSSLPPLMDTCFSKKEDWGLCRVFFKSRGTASNLTETTVNRYDHNASSSLPLMDTYITFDHATGNHNQTQMSNMQGFHPVQHVPCFSNTLSTPTTAMSHQPAPPMQPASQLPADVNPFLMNPKCEIKVIKAVLSHLTMLEGGQKREASMSSGDGAVESYLSTEEGLQNMW